MNKTIQQILDEMCQNRAGTLVHTCAAVETGINNSQKSKRLPDRQEHLLRVTLESASRAESPIFASLPIATWLNTLELE